MFSMYKAYFRLKHVGITAHSVKIDAFTIKAEDKKKQVNKLIALLGLEAGE